MKMNDDYKILEVHQSYIDKDDIATIEVLTGKFKSTQFTFGTLSIHEDKEKDTATLSFDYKVHNNPSLEKDAEFELVLEQILHDILQGTLTEAEQEYERRKKDPEAFD